MQNFRLVGMLGFTKGIIYIYIYLFISAGSLFAELHRVDRLHLLLVRVSSSAATETKTTRY